MFELRFRIDNEAFQNGGGREETARILEKIAKDIKDGCNDGYIWDRNGNKVGAWFV